MSSMGDMVERLVILGVTPRDAVTIIDEAVAYGATRPTAKKRKQESSPSKGSRLPADFVCDVDYALSKGLHRNVAQREAERFRNYWASAPGQKGIKLRWDLTWQNWVLSVADKLGAVPRGIVGTMAVDPRKMTPEEWRPILAIYAKTSNWNPAYGPSPDQAGFLGPKQGGLF